jgi:hypothetical protein
LASFANPDGDINNSELELVDIVAQQYFLAHLFDMREATIHNVSKNVAALWWKTKGATSLQWPTAQLLRLQVQHQHHYRYVPLYDYILVEANAMADDCIRMWHLSYSQLITYFYSVFPHN